MKKYEKYKCTYFINAVALNVLVIYNIYLFFFVVNNAAGAEFV